MPTCHDMKKGEIYTCEGCGFEIQILKECTSCQDTTDCSCEEHCDFSCCGSPMVKK